MKLDNDKLKESLHSFIKVVVGKNRRIKRRVFKEYLMPKLRLFWIIRNIHWMYAAGQIDEPSLAAVIDTALRQFIHRMNTIKVDALCEQPPHRLGNELTPAQVAHFYNLLQAANLKDTGEIEADGALIHIALKKSISNLEDHLSRDEDNYPDQDDLETIAIARLTRPKLP